MDLVLRPCPDFESASPLLTRPRTQDRHSARMVGGEGGGGTLIDRAEESVRGWPRSDNDDDDDDDEREDQDALLMTYTQPVQEITAL